MDKFNKVEVLDKANYFALIEGKQFMFCTNRKRGDYLILWCKSDMTKPKYKLSPKGLEYTENKRFEDESFYLGKITYLNFRENNLNLWQELYDMELFYMWDPKGGPFRYNSTNLKRIAVCQVFKMDCTIVKDDIGKGRTSRILKNKEKLKMIERFIAELDTNPKEQKFIDATNRIKEIVDKYK